jgi:hypothetical protein
MESSRELAQMDAAELRNLAATLYAQLAERETERSTHAALVAELKAKCAISRNGPARFRVNGPTLHGLPAEPRFESSTRPFSLRQVFWL